MLMQCYLFYVQKPPLKREDSFLKRFSTRQIPEAQEIVEDTGSEGAPGDSKAPRRRRRFRKQPRTVVNPDENFYFYWLLILTICVLYNMWTLIVRQSFPELQVSNKEFLTYRNQIRKKSIDEANYFFCFVFLAINIWILVIVRFVK